MQVHTIDHSKTKNISGFTLVELLVVLGILAVLMTILFPVFGTARDRARQSVCLSNEKQIGAAFLQYTQDYDELYPGGIAAANAMGRVPYGWGGQLYPYLKSVGIFTCPSDRGNGTNKNDRGSYAYNSNFCNWKTDQPSGVTIYRGIMGQSGKLSAPSATVLLFEVQSYGLRGPDVVAESQMTLSPTGDNTETGNGQSGQLYGDNLRKPGAYATGVIGRQSVILVKYQTTPMNGGFLNTGGRHASGSNYVLADGHVQWIRPEAVSYGYTAITPSDSFAPNWNSGAGTIPRASGAENGIDGYKATFSPI